MTGFHSGPPVFKNLLSEERRVFYYGKDSELPFQVALKAGPLEVIYENGNLRYMKLGETEVVRMIYSAVRDQNWATIEGELKDEKIEVEDNAFRISYRAIYQSGEINFTSFNSIEGKANGEIIFHMEGEALSTFKKNRIGFCILHPIAECAGKDVEIIQPDGIKVLGLFPKYISPHQPFRNIQGMKWAVEDECTAILELAGDVFEMEDQRNWTDASFKTYCTPLEIPFPVTINKGEKVRQSVKLSLKGTPSKILPALERQVSASESEGLSIIVHSQIGDALSNQSILNRTLPRVGLCKSRSVKALTAAEIEKIKSVGFSHYRIDIYLDTDWKDMFNQACGEAVALGLSLEVAMFFSTEPELQFQEFLAEWEVSKPSVCAFLLFESQSKTSSRSLLTAITNKLKALFPDSKIGAGTDGYFAQLNRNTPSSENLDFISYSVNPQVHAFDNASLTETLEAQKDTVESALQMFPDLEIQVSPVTLKPRYNIDATGPEQPPAKGDLPNNADVRQMSLFCAAWTLGAIKNLSEAGVSDITIFETVGMRGVIQGSEEPETIKFKAEQGDVFPVYLILKSILEFGGGEVLLSSSSQPLKLNSLVLKKEDRKRMIVSNFSPESQQIKVKNFAEKGRIRGLEETNCQQLMKSPEIFFDSPGEYIEAKDRILTVNLKPYATAIIDATEINFKA